MKTQTLYQYQYHINFDIDTDIFGLIFFGKISNIISISISDQLWFDTDIILFNMMHTFLPFPYQYHININFDLDIDILLILYTVYIMSLQYQYYINIKFPIHLFDMRSISKPVRCQINSPGKRCMCFVSGTYIYNISSHWTYICVCILLYVI